jgi:hypothetical protein
MHVSLLKRIPVQVIRVYHASMGMVKFHSSMIIPLIGATGTSESSFENNEVMEVLGWEEVLGGLERAVNLPGRG